MLIFNWLYDVAAKRPPLPPRFHRELIEPHGAAGRLGIALADRVSTSGTASTTWCAA